MFGKRKDSDVEGTASGDAPTYMGGKPEKTESGKGSSSWQDQSDSYATLDFHYGWESSSDVDTTARREPVDGSYGSDSYGGNGSYGNGQYGNGSYGGGQYGGGQYGNGNGQYGNGQYGNDSYGNGQYGYGQQMQTQPQYGSPGQPPQGGQGAGPDASNGGNGRKKRMSTRKWVLVCTVLAIVFFFGGVAAANNGLQLFNDSPREYAEDEQAPATEVAMRLYQVAKILDATGYFDIDLDEATANAIQALLDSTGDNYAVYYSEDEYQSYIQYSSGAYYGIGVVITLYGNYTVVSEVYEGSPAEEAGVQAGDVVVSVDGVEQDWTPTSFTETIATYSEGDEIEIVWLRPTDESFDELIDAVVADSESEDSTSALAEQVVLEGEQVTTTCIYSEITIPNISYELIDGVGYIELTSFNLEAGEEVAAAIEDLESQGATSLVLDLRDNGGGYVSQAIEIVSLFVEEGLVMQYDYGGITTTESVTGETITDLPLVVLVNENSASASEIVAAALQDHERATIVGTVTYGKGTVQSITPLSFGGAIKYTISEYLSADGNTINGVGVTPDIEVSYTVSSDGSDSQLDAALEAAAALAE